MSSAPSAGRDRLNGWGKIIATVLPLAIIGFIALVTLAADVRHQEKDLDAIQREKADRRELEAVLREVQGARDDIAELRRVLMQARAGQPPE